MNQIKFYCYGGILYTGGKALITSGYLKAKCKCDAENTIRKEVKDSEIMTTLVITEIPIEFLMENLSQDTLIDALHPNCR